MGDAALRAAPLGMTNWNCTGVVLAGGRATRLNGVAKGLEVVGDRRMIDRVASALAAVTDSLLLVANDPAAGDWLPGVRCVSDRTPGMGPLAGIQTALASTNGPILVVAWDMPFVTPELLRMLIDAAGEGEIDAVVPVGQSPSGAEPLCAWYAQSCLAAVTAALARGDRAADSFLSHVRTELVSRERVSRFGDPELLLRSVNDHHDLAAARKFAESETRIG